MLKPDIYLTSVLEITPNLIKKLNGKAIILDVDNTIRQHKDKKIFDGVINWVNVMKSCGVFIVIASNNYRKSVEPIANELGLPCVSFCLKPFPFGLKKAAKMLGFKKENIVVVGDQFFTDIIGGKFLKFKTILTKPLKQEEGFFWGIRRNIEKKILKKILK